MPGTVLVAGGDARMVETLHHTLAREGFRVATAQDGRTALAHAGRLDPDLIVLDAALPGADGMDLWHRLRTTRHLALILLTARDDPAERIAALDLGADDCLARTVSPRELLARVRAVLRRSGSGQGSAAPCRGDPVTVGDVRVDPATREARVGGRPVRLRPQEVALLLALARSEGRVLSRETLLRHAWGYGAGGATRTVDKHVVALRARLRDSAVRIETVRGLGYKLVARRA
jgi:DNA-binding response OmpR family regulator